MKKLINKLLKLYKKYEELVNYVSAGGMTTFVSLASKWILLFAVFDPKNEIQLQASVIISWICAVSFAYAANRIFVFKSKNENILKELITFFSARVVTLLLEMLIMFLAVTVLKMDSDTWVLVWTLLCQIIILVLNYVFSKLIVFKKKKC